jgi:hypothetical protein
MSFAQKYPSLHKLWSWLMLDPTGLLILLIWCGNTTEARYLKECMSTTRMEKLPKFENDTIDNLMLLTAEWNLRFMPVLARGFGVPESRVTAAYVLVEHLPYEQRFIAVCKFLQETNQ